MLERAKCPECEHNCRGCGTDYIGDDAHEADCLARELAAEHRECVELKAERDAALLKLSSALDEIARLEAQHSQGLAEYEQLESRLDSLVRENETLGSRLSESNNDKNDALGRLDAALGIMRLVQEDYGRGLDECAGLNLVKSIEEWMGGVVERHDPFSVPCPFCMARAGEECDGTEIDLETGKMVKLPRPYCHSQRAA